ncbi:ATP-binding cassette domain-containing protein [Vibrio sp. La 4.2.2]|uniref:ATP-binding cassette domain-containing protein n=1 Tax=Vibrio sp. La 4.2.2 TaxID=2998830 RepID=UPI0022CE14A6|nr:ATP-binding cassette domain-containing protein [Vibrio sp. La 4.2.2]MDA0110069.1 ATP-binding cassette domain-containing protein [Vibrio sp. La 4.2.2]
MKNELEFRGVSKNFPGVKALSKVSFRIGHGEVHGLIGANGAGKSTLMKVLGGIHKASEGEVHINGASVNFQSPIEAINGGIAIIHQELQLVPEQTVAENIFLGRFPTKGGVIDWPTMNQQAQLQLDKLGLTFAPSDKVNTLSMGQQQMVEIAKALILNANIIALDEPTSSLSAAETETLFRVIRQLQSEGKILIYISHRMAEIFEVCSSATVMKDGCHVITYDDIRHTDRPTLIEKMIGRNLGDMYSFRERSLGDDCLVLGAIESNQFAKPVQFRARTGEVLGFFGLVGSGRTELMKSLIGALPTKSISMQLDGIDLQALTPKTAIQNGIIYCSEDRKKEGNITFRSVLENITISSRRNYWKLGGILDLIKETKSAEHFVNRLDIKTPNLAKEIQFLSGGNQQKVILARWLSESSMNVLIVDEPTRGIDVSAKNQIYNVLYELAEQGVTIIVISSELPEVMGITDRLYVMRENEISAEFLRHQYSEEKILSKAFPEKEITV